MGDAPEVSKLVFLWLGAQSSRRGGIARAWHDSAEGTAVPSAPMKRQGLRGDCSHRKQPFCSFFLNFITCQSMKAISRFLKSSIFLPPNTLWQANNNIYALTPVLKLHPRIVNRLT